MKAWISAVLAAGVVITTMPSARAGQREWARAGRVLTGYVLLRALVGDGLWPVTSEPVVTWAAPRTWAGHGVMIAEPVPARVRTPWPPASWAPERWEGQPTPLRPIEETEPLVVPLPDGRRLYQPARAGSPAYVQTWDDEAKAWVSVARMPPLR